MVSVMPSAVSGLTKHEAPSAGVMPAGSGRHSLTFRQRYCAYMAPPIMATVLPISAFAASDDPVLITTPAPSLPTRHRLHRGFRDLRGDHRPIPGAGGFGGGHVGGANQESEVRRINRRGLDADHDFIGTGFRCWHAGERYFEFAAVLDQRAKLKPGFAI